MSGIKRTKAPLTSVSEILGSVMTGLEMPENVDLKGKVFLAWEQVAGEAASHTNPFRFRGSTLIVEVTESAWINELSMRKKDLLDRLEREVGARVAQDIRFEIKKKRRD